MNNRPSKMWEGKVQHKWVNHPCSGVFLTISTNMEQVVNYYCAKILNEMNRLTTRWTVIGGSRGGEEQGPGCGPSPLGKSQVSIDFLRNIGQDPHP